MTMNNAVRIDNSLFRAVAECCEQKEFSFIPGDEELRGAHIFSEAHRNKMLILADSVEKHQKVSIKVKVLLVLAALIALIAAMAVGAGGVHDAEYEMVVKEHGHYINVSYRCKGGGEGELAAPNCLEFVYEVAAPKGYDLVYRNINCLESRLVFETPEPVHQNGTGHSVHFMQGTLQGKFTINIENTEWSTSDINGVSCVCLSSEGWNHVTWVQYGYVFSMMSDDDITMDGLIAMAEKMYVNEELTELISDTNIAYHEDQNGITVTDQLTGEIIPYP